MSPSELERAREAAREVPGATLVVVFGSMVRGELTAWSDVEVGVLGVDLWRGLEIGSRVGAVFGREPHVVELEHAPDWLRWNVAREGILLHEGEPHAWARFRAESAVRWYDVKPFVDLCAAGVRRRLRELAGHG